MHWIAKDALPTSLSKLMDNISRLETQISVLREEARMTSQMPQQTAMQPVQHQPFPIARQGMLHENTSPHMIAQNPMPVYYASNDYSRGSMTI